MEPLVVGPGDRLDSGAVERQVGQLVERCAEVQSEVFLLWWLLGGYQGKP